MKNSVKLVGPMIGLIALAACASAPQPAPPVASNASDGTPVTCVRDTGTRIKPRTERECLNQPGRTYDRDAIDSTGATNAGDALRNLDPSITTTH